MKNFTPLENLLYNTFFVGFMNGAISVFFHRSTLLIVVAVICGIVGYLACVIMDYKNMQDFLNQVWSSGIFPSKEPEES